MKARRALVLFLVAGGCFGLGLVVARGLGWGPPPAPPTSPSGLATAPGLEPRIYIDAGEIVLYDGSLKIDPPPPPNIEPP